MRIKLIDVVLVLFLLVLVARVVLADETAKLQTMEPLPKPLLIWGVSNFDSMEELRAWSAVTRSCPIHLTFSNDEKVATCVDFVNNNPGTVLSVTYSPLNAGYRRIKDTYFPDRRKINHEKLKFILDLGERWEIERDRVIDRLTVLSRKMDGARVVVMFDHESSIINDMTIPVLCHKLNILGDAARVLGFEVFFYNFNAQREDQRSKTGWSRFNQVPECVESDYASLSLYWPTEVHHGWEDMRRTLAATEKQVVPFVSFGWRWVRTHSGGRTNRVRNTEFDPVFTKMIADDLHSVWKARSIRHYDNTRVPFIFSWPGVDRFPNFWLHFYAYHEGATD